MDMYPTRIVFALLLAAALLCGCNKQADSSKDGKAGGAAAEQEAEPVVLEQEQQVPDAEQFEVDSQVMEERGASTQLPASWPSSLTLPDGATITQAASREGGDVIEFSINAPLTAVAAHLAADASIAGYTLREAQVDKFSQSRRYTANGNLYSTTVTEVDGTCFGVLTIAPQSENLYFSESTHFTGEFSLPTTWPGDILPVYPGCTLRELHVPIKPGGRLMLSAQTTDSEDSVIAWMEEQLPAAGWTLTGEESRNGFSIRNYEGNGYSLSAAARGNGGVTTIQYEASAP